MKSIITAPIIILIRPQMGENIGAVARAMSNFGLSELRLVAPRDGWPNQRANDMAAGGLNIIENAKIYPDFASAMVDIHCAYATTARSRDMNKRTTSPSEAMAEILANNQQQATNNRTAIVFGAERTGMENEDVVLCDAIINIPTSAENPSLNLGQAAVIIGYEWAKASIEFGVLSVEKNTRLHSTLQTPNSAPKGEYLGLFEQLENYLDQAEYFRTEQKKAIMWKNLRTMLLRGAWNEQEIRTMRGMLRALWERK